ncbi:SDR family oxidoreductase [Accumulibacter sp.]|uniref:SDR family oxidoreductase n=1 Tax=Accumulibacter sp. TaxID=2053492 RepID=UPI00261EE963|nr:SDR family oxidoreductase [Accumulibacter sp.]
MPLKNSRILLTGATGGLGQELARQLGDAGAALLVTGRDDRRLASLTASLGTSAASVCADLERPADIVALAGAARDFGINTLINNAGVSAFALLENQDWQTIERLLATNLEAPMRLTHALLPWLRAQPQAAVVNIGSTFGSLPFPGFVAYSTAKAGLRGFSQALRRELADSSVSVIHIAPRAIDTPLNSDPVNTLNRALGNSTDRAEQVAGQVLRALRRGAGEYHFGFPERFFAWLNGVAPSLIDGALSGKLAIIKQHASPSESL